MEEEKAFACASESVHQAGLTKREYFAVMAMQGLAVGGGVTEHIVQMAVQIADQLQLELDRTKQD